MIPVLLLVLVEVLICDMV